MILQNHPLQHPQQPLALLRMQFINILRKRSQSENSLPSRHRVRPHDRMHSLQFLSDVQGRTARFTVNADLLGIGSCGFEETITYECRGEGFEEFSVGLGEAVVDFVAGCPAL